ncbi:DUF2875 family protein [Burkholderia sp. FERM BP-3421]|uniref:type VI lipase adapter Tla3 domain-containing protein n=1 Tax=Burkholderia sp. FERM BP-3421 TaxID=1494466 RepID=UPI002361E85E|nr:DUF2875 family protein [Burkholderia sp. FERM BP-3421]WDD91223.1 DUF2875 family protein [Burkholderia sp. FERM BP-3421]
MIAKPRPWPYIAIFVLTTLIWIVLVMARSHRYWEEAGQEMFHMGSYIRNGVLVVLAVIIFAYGLRAALIHRLSASAGHLAESNSGDITERKMHGFNGSPAMLSQTGSKYVLEVRGASIVTGWETNHEIWREIEAKKDNHQTYMSQNPEDYPDNDGHRLDNHRIVSGTGFKFAARRAVEYWPVPVIIWGPPKDKRNDYRAAKQIAGLRQKASLGVTLLLWGADANTDDGVEMIEKLFAFFDAHPDVPEVLVFSSDGSMLRSLLRPPGSGGAPQAGHIIPERPDCSGGMLFARSDRVDKLVRPFVIDQTAQINKNSTGYDITKLWNFFWATNDDRGPDSFNAHYLAQEKAAGVDDPSALGSMSLNWWHAQLPELWKTIDNKGPGDFTPTPYLPVRWTTWQLKKFDSAPLLGYLHRPVDVKLTDDHGRPLKTSAQATALQAGWEQARAALPDGQEPKRVFYDTTGDRLSMIPLNRALAQIGGPAPNLNDVEEGYDIGARIGNTGVTSPLIQIGLGLIASYQNGGASATVNRRPNGTTSIIMVSPPDAEIKAAWDQKTSGANPFK